MKATLNCLLGCLLLVGCSSGNPAPDSSRSKSDQSLVHQTKATVMSRLRDPNSAEFGEVYANNKGIVCGTVNAKNAFGGYVGFAAFWYDPKSGEAYVYDPDQDWSGKGYDARLFIQRGCSIGSEENQALDVARELDASDKRLGIKPFAPEPTD